MVCGGAAKYWANAGAGGGEIPLEGGWAVGGAGMPPMGTDETGIVVAPPITAGFVKLVGSSEGGGTLQVVLVEKAAEAGIIGTEVSGEEAGWAGGMAPAAFLAIWAAIAGWGIEP